MTDIEKKRTGEAVQFLDDAEFLYRERIGNLQLMTKLYHAMLYSLFALFNIESIGHLTHSDIIGTFDREYIQKGIFSETLLDALNHAYAFTHECDCAHTKQPEDREIEKLLPITREFVSSVRGYLQSS
ncbi:hypothetical protein BMS3Abin07_02484 [bacterium BMS3Abin07]|nr:hypothetical protein BMS3Abin07_02484 [bacterium BMS3Abin07]GBE33401.1 hypothetical protein BMS3Bbin05_02342 [bacterium BMS3Bbin05]